MYYDADLTASCFGDTGLVNRFDGPCELNELEQTDLPNVCKS